MSTIEEYKRDAYEERIAAGDRDGHITALLIELERRVSTLERRGSRALALACAVREFLDNGCPPASEHGARLRRALEAFEVGAP